MEVPENYFKKPFGFTNKELANINYDGLLKINKKIDREIKQLKNTLTDLLNKCKNSNEFYCEVIKNFNIGAADEKNNPSNQVLNDYSINNITNEKKKLEGELKEFLEVNKEARVGNNQVNILTGTIGINNL